MFLLIRFYFPPTAYVFHTSACSKRPFPVRVFKNTDNNFSDICWSFDILLFREFLHKMRGNLFSGFLPIF